MKKNCLKLLFFVATLFMMGQEAAAQIVDRWEIPGLKDSGMDAEYTGYFYTIGGNGGPVMLSWDRSHLAAVCRTDLQLQYDISDGLVVDIPHTDSKIGMFQPANHQLWISSVDVPYFLICNE